MSSGASQYGPLGVGVLPRLWERWGHLATVGDAIECPEMTLIAEDHDPPIVQGKGQLRVKSETTWSYELKGVPNDVGHALRSLHRIRRDPYDGRLRSRLSTIDTRGVAMSMGWTLPSVCPEVPGAAWTFTGECEEIWLVDEPPPRPVTEDLFLLPRHHRSRVVLRRFFPTPSVPGAPVERCLDVAGNEIVFTLYDDVDMLTITAPATKTLPLTYTENWLAEPLRIMFGQLAYPRIVAHGQDERTTISIRPSHKWDARSDACGLWGGVRELTDEAGFWDTYAALLRRISEQREADGHPQFEANKITRLYEEVIQAAHSSRWLSALAHASAVEGVVLLMTPRGTPRAGADPTMVEDICKHIDKWTGADAHLKHVAKSAARRTLETSAVQALRDLRDKGDLTRDQFKVWDKLRNQVMHGGLVSPYSSAEEDELLLHLSDLLHAVTHKLVSVQ